MNTTRLDISLTGYEVGLSGAVPARAEWTEPAMDRGILEFVALLTSLVVKYGGRIVHGAHPTFMPVILRHAQQHATGRERQPVTLVMSELWATGYSAAELDALRQTAELVITPKIGVGGPEDTETRNSSLTRMRKTLLQRMNVMVAVGGKLHENDGRVAGVEEEMHLARQRGIACFLVGGLGGMASKYAKGLQSSAALRNELSGEHNEQLFNTNDVAATVSIIFEQLASGTKLLDRELQDVEIDLGKTQKNKQLEEIDDI